MSLFDLQAAMRVHADYKLGRARMLWRMPEDLAAAKLARREALDRLLPALTEAERAFWLVWRQALPARRRKLEREYLRGLGSA